MKGRYQEFNQFPECHKRADPVLLLLFALALNHQILDPDLNKQKHMYFKEFIKFTCIALLNRGKLMTLPLRQNCRKTDDTKSIPAQHEQVKNTYIIAVVLGARGAAGLLNHY